MRLGLQARYGRWLLGLCARLAGRELVSVLRPVGRWSLQSGFTGGVLDERHHAAGHEPRPTHGLTVAGHLGNVNDPPAGRDFDPPSGSCGRDLVGTGAVVSGHDDLDAIAFHGSDRTAG